jgi:hypothetical protein
MIGLFTRRPDLSFEEFVTYYEEHHVPLIRRVLPRFDGYSRNYVSDPADRQKLGYDVFTEARFDTAEAFENVLRTMAEPEVAEAIATDEERFMDRARSQSFQVDQRD